MITRAVIAGISALLVLTAVLTVRYMASDERVDDTEMMCHTVNNVEICHEEHN